MDPIQQPVLSYVSDDAQLAGAAWRRPDRWPKVPVEILALLVLIVANVFSPAPRSEYYPRDPFNLGIGLALLLPALLKSRSARRIAAVLITAAGLLAAWLLISRARAPDGDLFHLVMLGVAEITAFCCWRPWRDAKPARVLRACLASLAICGVTLTLYNLQGSLQVISRHPKVAQFAPVYVILLFLWLGTRWLTQPAYRRWWTRSDFFAVPLAVLLTASVFAYQRWIVPPLALHSLKTGGPLDPMMGSAIFIRRPEYREQIWEILETADWSSPNKDAELWRAREFALMFLDLRTPAELQRLARLVNMHPLILSDPSTASLLVSQRQYACIPVILRFALFGRDEECTRALETMGVPEAAWPIFFNYEASEADVNTRYRETHAAPLDSQTRGRLRALLGSDPGADYSGALELLEKTAVGRHPPIPDDVAEEADQTVALYRAYTKTQGFPREHMLSDSIPENEIPLLSAPDFASLKREVERRLGDESLVPPQ